MKLITRPLDFVERAFFFLACFVLAAMMLMISIDVFGSYFLRMPVESTITYTEFGMVALVYLGLANAQRHKKHIHVDVVLTHLPHRWRVFNHTVVYFLMLIFFGFLFFSNVEMARESWAIQEQAMGMGMDGLPVYPAKTLVPLGAFLICIRLIVDVVEGIEELVRGGRG